MKILKALILMASVSLIYTSTVHSLFIQVDSFKTNLPPVLLKIVMNYQLELALAAILIISIANYFKGKKKNQSLATRWVRKNIEFFKKSFRHVGVSNKEDGPLIAEDSPHCFKFMATGRNNVDFFLTTFEVFSIL